MLKYCRATSTLTDSAPELQCLSSWTRLLPISLTVWAGSPMSLKW